MSKHKKISPHLQQLHCPRDLRHRVRFCGWEYGETAVIRNGVPKRPKIPVQLNGQAGVAIDAVHTLGSYEEAVEMGVREGWDGIGFVLSPGDDISIVDFDECIANGMTHEEVVAATAGTYVEVSASRKGEHAFVFGKLPGHHVGEKQEGEPYGLDIFVDRGFVALTGEPAPRCVEAGLLETIAPPSEALLALIKRRYPNDHTYEGGPGAVPDPMGYSIEELGKMIRQLPNDEVDYEQYITVCAAINHETGGSDEGFEIFQGWCEKAEKNGHVRTNRSKYDSFTRGEARARERGCGRLATIQSLMQHFHDAGVRVKVPRSVADDFEPVTAEEQAQAEQQESDQRAKDRARRTKGIKTLNFKHLATFEPLRPENMLEVLAALPLGEPALLVSHGGLGKSTCSTSMAVASALGLPFMGEEIRERKVAYLSFEDPENVLHWRLANICRAIGAELEDLDGKLIVEDCTQFEGCWYDKQKDGRTGFTPEFKAMRERLQEQGAEFIIVDGCNDVYAGDEINRAQVKAFVRGLRTLIPKHGALLLLAHVDKKGAEQGASAQGYSGSTAWHNAVRSRLFMFEELDADEAPTGNVVIDVRKANWGKAGGRMLVRYDERAHVFRRVDDPTVSDDEGAERTALLDLITHGYESGSPIPSARVGSRTCHSVAEAREGLPQSMRGQRGRKRFYRAIEWLMGTGQVLLENRKTGCRHSVDVLKPADSLV